MQIGMGIKLQSRGATNAIASALATRAGISWQPWRLDTLFTDAGGTVAATAPGDIIYVQKCPVKTGAQFVQATLANRPVLVRYPKRGRVNLLVNTGFSAATTGTPGASPTSWTAAFSAGTQTVAADAGLGGNSIRISTTAAKHVYAQTAIPVLASTVYIFSMTAFVTTGQRIDDIISFTSFPAGATVDYLIDGSVVAASVVPSAGSHTIAARLTVAGTAGTTQARFGLGVAGYTPTADITFSNPQLEPGSATAYQKVATTYDITESGQAACWGLQYDGTNDSMATAATLDLSASDKVAVFAGVTKLSDSARRTALEHTASVAANNGGFQITAPDAASATVGFESKGTALSTVSEASLTQPQNMVLAGIGDISADTLILRRNGTQTGTAATDQGTGNYANATTYLGSRGAASQFLSGILWGGCIVSTLTTADATTISAIERQIAANTPGVTL